MSNKIFITLVFLALGFAGCTKKEQLNPRETQTLVPGLRIGAQQTFHSIENFPFEPAGLHSFADPNENILKISSAADTAKIAALKNINKRSAQITRLYQIEQDPYLGSESLSKACAAPPADEKHLESPSSLERTFYLTATKQFVLGVCTSGGSYYKVKALNPASNEG